MNEQTRRLCLQMKALYLGLPSLMADLRNGSLPAEKQDEFGALHSEIGADVRVRADTRTPDFQEASPHA